MTAKVFVLLIITTNSISFKYLFKLFVASVKMACNCVSSVAAEKFRH